MNNVMEMLYKNGGSNAGLRLGMDYGVLSYKIRVGSVLVLGYNAVVLHSSTCCYS